ncbi:MAG: hypothetical protein K9H65_05660 [Bacteroidales bacterium]|nr:hypothetical protein [Bacteroidales bacterium]
MSREVLYEDKNLRLEYVPEGNYIHETWWGATPGNRFSELLDIILENLAKKNGKGLLLDAREHKGLGPENQKLAAQRLEEYAQAYGSIKHATIIPEDVFSKYSVSTLSTNLKPDELVINRYFDNIEDAENWLKED